MHDGRRCDCSGEIIRTDSKRMDCRNSERVFPLHQHQESSPPAGTAACMADVSAGAPGMDAQSELGMQITIYSDLRLGTQRAQELRQGQRQKQGNGVQDQNGA